VINLCWFCFKWGGLIGLVGAAAVALHFYQRRHDEVRARIETAMAAHYPGLQVRVGSAQIVEGEGIRVRRVRIIEPGAEGPHAELLVVDEMTLVCGTDVRRLLAGDVKVQRLVVRRPVLRVTRRRDGSYSAAKLLPLPHVSDDRPEVRIEGGTIELFDPTRNPSSTLTLRDVNMVLHPPEGDAAPHPNARWLEGTLGGDHFQRMALKGSMDAHDGAWDLSGVVEGLTLSPQLRDALPGPVSTHLYAVDDVRGQASLTFRVSRNPGDPQPDRFAVSGRLSHGRIDDRRLPYPLTDARATFRLSEDGFAIDNLTARANEATVRLSSGHSGFGSRAPVQLTAEIRQLELSRPLIEVLPEPLKQQWYRYRPAGQIDVDLQLAFDGHTWTPTVEARLLDVSFTHIRFPYRLEHGVGTVQLADGRVQINVRAHSGNEPVRIDAELADALGSPHGWLRLQSNAIPLDEKLLVALPGDSQEVVRSLQPRGTIRVDYRMWRELPEGPMHKHLLVELNRCALRYDKFPYPVHDIRGTIEMRDDHWQFRDLEGRNDAGRVVCHGHLQSRPEGREFRLSLQASDIPLEGELRDALTPNVRSLWEDLRPRGMVDLSAEIRYLAEKRHLSVSTRIHPQADTTSIDPVRFPYRMEKLQGEIVYRDGHVSFDRLEAEHGGVQISTAGDCEILPDGRWLLRLSGLSVDRLRFDRDLVQALPDGLRRSLTGLNPAGLFNLRGSVDLEGGVRADDRMQAAWNVRVGFHQASIDCGVKLENMHGGLTLSGRFDGVRMASGGELDIDSLTYKDFQFTQVTGPLWIDDQQVLLGSWVERRRPAEERSSVRARPVAASLFGGVINGDAWITLGPVPRWGLHATLNQADLARCAQEVLTGEHRLQGKLHGALDLRGAGSSTNAMVGHGAIRLDGADVYELPLMIALLKILSVRTPDRNAFSKSDIRFRVEGQHIYFDQIDFSGDAISLLGKGEMDFQQNVRMTFHAIVGRGELDLPVLKQVVGGASQQIMLIHVTGTMQQPETRREAFPVVNKALQHLQTDLHGKPEPTGWFPKNLFRWR
jgi:hypothetical protein